MKVGKDFLMFSSNLKPDSVQEFQHAGVLEMGFYPQLPNLNIHSF